MSPQSWHVKLTRVGILMVAQHAGLRLTLHEFLSYTVARDRSQQRYAVK
jgi:hypothetical protein